MYCASSWVRAFNSHLFCIPWRDAKILAHRPRKLRPGAAVGYMYNVKGTEHTGQRQVLPEADAGVQLEKNIYNVKGNEHTGQRGERLETEAAVQAKICTT